jgi:hypothetical protein
MAECSEKQMTSVYVDSATRSPRVDLYGSRAANRVFDQLERDTVADRKCIERHALAHIAAMKKDVATIAEPYEAVTLADDQRGDSADARNAVALSRPAGDVASRRCLANGVPRVLAHVPTSAVPSGDEATARRCGWPSDGPR